MAVLRKVPAVGNAYLSEQLEVNLHAHFTYGLLEAGNFFNVTIPSSGAFGGGLHRLRPADDPYLAAGQAWQGYRTDWVWETGVAGQSPIRVSGVFVDGAFRPATGVGPYAHTVDYPRGRVVFSSPVPLSSVVTCEFSPRWCQFHTADAPWWRQVQLDSFRADDGQFSLRGSGAWDVLAENRVQLPAVVVEAAPRASRRGLMLGSDGAIVQQDVYFTVLAEDPNTMKKFHDIITRQCGHRFDLFDVNRMSASGDAPLDGSGSPVAGALTYPQLVERHRSQQLRLLEAQSAQRDFQPASPLHACAVRILCEVDEP